MSGKASIEMVSHFHFSLHLRKHDQKYWIKFSPSEATYLRISFSVLTSRETQTTVATKDENF
jgi:hypothetical protein